MRRADVGGRGISGPRFPLRLPLGQQSHQPGQPVDLAGLTGDDVRQILDRAGQVGDPFLKALYPVHQRLSGRLPPLAPFDTRGAKKSEGSDPWQPTNPAAPAPKPRRDSATISARR